jgi:hypothetical protein
MEARSRSRVLPCPKFPYLLRQANKVFALHPLRILARPKRFELLTPRFVVWCSIQLSYGRF